MVLPIVSLLPFLNRNMDQKFAVLSKGPNFDQQNGYNTLYQAREDGALVLAYGYVYPPQLLMKGILFVSLTHIYADCLSRQLSTSWVSALLYTRSDICTC